MNLPEIKIKVTITEGDKVYIKKSSDIHEIMKNVYKDGEEHYYEQIHALYVNRRGRLIGVRLLGKGTSTHSICNVQELFKTALDVNSCGVILVHNHPSGEVNPSDSDVRLTKNIKEFGSMIYVDLVDHLIYADKEYYSFADNGEL